MRGRNGKVKPFSAERSALLDAIQSYIRMTAPAVPMPNIYDVAKRARVSVATVSAVLNDSAFVSPGLKTRVESAVAALRFQPNLIARGLAKQRTQTLGMI